jgi:hypothetical protein
MRPRRSIGFSLVLAGLLAAPAAMALPAARLAQTEPVPGQPRQRAPGVPLAPNPAEAGRAGAETPRADGSLRGGRAEQAQRNATPEPGRDPPMPRGVPSIIQN